MVDLQIISKIIATGDFSIIEDNYITDDYFRGHKNSKGEDLPDYYDEFRFIKDHYERYGNVPDRETFIAKFPDYKDGGLPDVSESDQFLVEALREQYTFNRGLPILKRAAEIFVDDANAGVEYMINSLKVLEVNYDLAGTDIIADSDIRLEHYKDRVENQKDWYFTTGFPELDRIIHGIQRFEELVVIVARLGQGKSWVLEKIAAHIWKCGFRVGYISPEMGPDNVGYRFDTVYNGYSNSSLMWGLPDIDVDKYAEDLATLKEQKIPFIVSTPSQFDHRITISKLRNYIKKYKLDVLCIDGIKYMVDERYRKGDAEHVSLTHISEDLIELSVEMRIPILVVSQANRAGVKEDTPDMDNISGSDGIGQCATKTITLRQDDGNLEMSVKKNRYGTLGPKLKYIWNINIGEFIYTENFDDMTPEEKTERRERKKAAGKDIF